MPPTRSEKAICRLILEKFPLLLQKYPCHVASISLMSWLDFCFKINDEIKKNISWNLVAMMINFVSPKSNLKDYWTKIVFKMSKVWSSVFVNAGDQNFLIIYRIFVQKRFKMDFFGVTKLTSTFLQTFCSLDLNTSRLHLIFFLHIPKQKTSYSFVGWRRFVQLLEKSSKNTVYILGQ